MSTTYGVQGVIRQRREQEMTHHFSPFCFRCLDMLTVLIGRPVLFYTLSRNNVLRSDLYRAAANVPSFLTKAREKLKTSAEIVIESIPRFISFMLDWRSWLTPAMAWQACIGAQPQ